LLYLDVGGDETRISNERGYLIKPIKHVFFLSILLTTSILIAGCGLVGQEQNSGSVQQVQNGGDDDGNNSSGNGNGNNSQNNPEITLLSPDFGAPGSQISIMGTNLVSGTLVSAVLFGDVNGAVIQSSATELQVLVPAQSLPEIVVVDVKVDRGDGINTTLITGFTYTQTSSCDYPLSISGHPLFASKGLSMTIDGEGFDNPTVTLGGSSLPVFSSSPNQIAVIVPDLDNQCPTLASGGCIWTLTVQNQDGCPVDSPNTITYGLADADGDGDPDVSDCAPNDPNRFNGNTADMPLDGIDLDCAVDVPTCDFSGTPPSICSAFESGVDLVPFASGGYDNAYCSSVRVNEGTSDPNDPFVDMTYEFDLHRFKNAFEWTTISYEMFSHSYQCGPAWSWSGDINATDTFVGNFGTNTNNCSFSHYYSNNQPNYARVKKVAVGNVPAAQSLKHKFEYKFDYWVDGYGSQIHGGQFSGSCVFGD
jgi:hypothetical protein